MTDLDIALWNRINEIVQTESRPFSHIDFVPHFSVFGQDWSIGLKKSPCYPEAVISFGLNESGIQDIPHSHVD